MVLFNTWKDPLDVNGIKTDWKPEQTIVNVLNESETYKLKAEAKVDKITLGAYELKAFVLSTSLKKLNLTIQNISPKHDQTITITDATRSPIDITLTFSEDVDLPSLKINLNDVASSNAAISLKGNVATFKGQPKDGVNFIRVDQSAKGKSSGLNLSARFTSRFRYGLNNNILVNDQFNSDPALIGSKSSANITLNHHALGAEKFRVLFIHKNKAVNSNWSEWQAFKSTSSHTFPKEFQNGSSDLSEINVQYYADHSAAYYVKQQMSLGFIS